MTKYGYLTIEIKQRWRSISLHDTSVTDQDFFSSPGNQDSSSTIDCNDLISFNKVLKKYHIGVLNKYW